MEVSTPDVAHTILLAHSHDGNVFSTLPKEVVFLIAQKTMERVDIKEYIIMLTSAAPYSTVLNKAIVMGSVRMWPTLPYKMLYLKLV
ncbi:MAG: hypothetical protein CMM25_04665 [Rhodospirillaceae bacterium]|nr:hypothetical protein [Rhodospirillaceae bacterium]